MTKYDLAIFRGASPKGQLELLEQTILADSGAACTGIFALVQRWIITFMTAKGSLKYAPNRGTGFWTAARNGQLRTESDVYAEFLSARIEAAEQLLADSLDDPPDEVYGGVELTGVVIRPDRTLVLQVTLRSASGNLQKITVPVAVPVYGQG